MAIFLEKPSEEESALAAEAIRQIETQPLEAQATFLKQTCNLGGQSDNFTTLVQKLARNGQASAVMRLIERQPSEVQFSILNLGASGPEILDTLVAEGQASAIMRLVEKECERDPSVLSTKPELIGRLKRAAEGRALLKLVEAQSLEHQADILLANGWIGDAAAMTRLIKAQPVEMQGKITTAPLTAKLLIEGGEGDFVMRVLEGATPDIQMAILQQAHVIEQLLDHGQPANTMLGLLEVQSPQDLAHLLTRPGVVPALLKADETATVMRLIEAQDLHRQADILSSAKTVAALVAHGEEATVVRLIRVQPPAIQNRILMRSEDTQPRLKALLKKQS